MKNAAERAQISRLTPASRAWGHGLTPPPRPKLRTLNRQVAHSIPVPLMTAAERVRLRSPVSHRVVLPAQVSRILTCEVVAREGRRVLRRGRLVRTSRMFGRCASPLARLLGLV